jgi:outer membrane protein assembly factor BamB
VSGGGAAIRPRGQSDPEAWGRVVRILRAATLFSTALLVLVLVVQLVRWYEDRQARKDLVTGAQGAFPAPLGTTAPATPDHVLRRTTADWAVVHGLSVRLTDQGVRAVNVRTGKQYWRYERRDADVAAMSVAASERTVVTAYGDGRIVAVDLRTGRPRWHADLPEGQSRRTGNVELTGGQVVTGTPDGVRALAERDGRPLWTARTPGSCDETPVDEVYDFAGHLRAVLVSCDVLGGPERLGSVEGPPRVEKSSDLLLGVDDRSGEILWRRPLGDGSLPLRRADGHTLLVDDSASPTRQTLEILDVNRTGVSRRGGFSVRRTYSVVAGDGVAVSNLDPGIYDTDSHTLLSAFDTQNGHLLWKLPAPSGQTYGSPAIADGRVYVVRQPVFRYADAGHRTQADLLVLDTADGRLLHTLRLTGLTVPKDVNAYATLDVAGLTDGAVGVSWRGERKELLLATG